MNVTNGLRLSLHTAPQGTFIAVAENRTENDPMSKLLLFQPDRSVKKVEMFNVSYVSDVIIWYVFLHFVFETIKKELFFM